MLAADEHPEFDERTGITFAYAPRLRAAGFVHGFSTRYAADGAELDFGKGCPPEKRRSNVKRFAAAIGFDSARLFTVTQVHGHDDVCVGADDDPDDVRRVEADALMSDQRVTLAILTADCVPVLLADPVCGVVAAIHSGWRGARDNIVGRVVARMGQRFGVKPETLCAAIGPAISAANYEVGTDVADTFRQYDGAVVGNERKCLDLRVVVRSQLQIAGVGSITRSRLCTYQDERRFFSFRRDDASSGRLLSAIRLGDKGLEMARR